MSQTLSINNEKLSVRPNRLKVVDRRDNHTDCSCTLASAASDAALELDRQMI